MCNTHAHKYTCMHMHTHTYTPLEPLTMSAPLQGNQAPGDRSAVAHVYIHGLNLASFLSAAGKRNVFNLHNPHLACSPRRNRESRPIVRTSSLQHNPFCRSECIYNFVHVCLYTVCRHAWQYSVCVLQRRK